MKANQPIIADANSMRKLGENLWWWRGRFLLREFTKDNSPMWYVFNKFVDGKGVDLCWFTPHLTSIRDLAIIMSEEIYHPIVEELNTTK